MTPLAPALQFSRGRFTDWGGASLVNCYAEKGDGDKRQDLALIAAPGLTEWAVVGAGPIRGSIVCADVLDVVSGASLYSVDNAGTETLIGAIGGTGPVRMACNASEVCIAANGTGYVYSGGTLSTPCPFTASDVVYADGYILWVQEDSEQFYISALDNALTYDGADIASVEGFPDNVVGVINDHREQLFFGSRSTEVFYNSGAAAFPFERQGNAFIERGCFDRDSIAKADNVVIFVGDDRMVYTLSGYQPQRISTHAIEYLLRDATYARAFTFTLEGHKFYVLECDRGTVAFDFATGAWHSRKSWGSDLWRIGGHVEAYGRSLFTDRATGQLFTASFDGFTEDGDTLEYEIVLPTIEGDRGRATMYAFEATIAGGVGNGTATDPQIMLAYSDDGGHRWSNELWRTLGAVGEYRTRAVWRRLGQFRQRQIKLRITDPASRFVIGFWADIQ